MPGLLDYISGLFGSPQYGPPAPPSTGMLTNPQGIREQALYGALGQLGAGLLAAGARRPVSQPSPLPQALASFGPAYRQGLQTGQQEAALERQADQERRWNDIATGTTSIPGIPAEMLPALRILGPTMGPQVVAQRMTRGNATPMDDAESIRIFGTTGGFRDQNGMPQLPQGPRTQGLTTDAQERARAPFHPIIEPPGGRIIENPGLAGRPPMPGAAPPAMPGQTPPPSTGSLYRPGAPPGDPRAGERPWVAEDWAGLPGMTQQDRQQRADDMNRIQGGITAPAPSMPRGPMGPRPGAPTQTAGGPRVISVSPTPAPGSQQGRFEAQAGENSAQYLNTRVVQPAEASIGALQTAARMRQILGTGDISAGPGSAVRDYIAEVARSYGGTTGAALADRIQGADYATLRALSARSVIDALGGSLGTGISSTDRDFIAATVPNPFQSNESMQRFLSLLEDRALGQIDRSLGVYARSAPNFNPQTDPFVNNLHSGLTDLGIDPANLRAERQRRQQAEAERRTPPPTPSATANGQPVQMAPGRPNAPAPAGAVPIPPPMQMAPRQMQGPQSQPLPERAPIGTVRRNVTTDERERFDGLRWVPITRDTYERAR